MSWGVPPEAAGVQSLPGKSYACLYVLDCPCLSCLMRSYGLSSFTTSYSRRFLRLFTISGLQGPVLWIPGDPVTVVGRNRFVAVFYHRSVSPMQDGTQLLGYSIFDGLTGAVVVSGEVSALSSGASLSWAGFTDKCALSIMDTDGMLSMLARYPSNNSNSGSGNWMPLLDTVGLKKNMNDSYWPVEVHGGKLICVPLRGRDHPDATRRPVTTALPLRIPLATGLTAKR